MKHEHEHHHHHGMEKVNSNVQVKAVYDDGRVAITVKDNQGDTVELLNTHEERMHLIIVSKDLETYLHIHPIEKEEGSFEIELKLENGPYYAFVDINPKGKSYLVEPLMINVGEDHKHHDPIALAKDEQLTKEINGKKVTLSHTELIPEKAVTLSFDLHGETPLPYLGALGHVVIIDEKIKQFIHVHPSSNDDTIFQAHFPKPGLYKLWAEFNFVDEGVIAFPYILEVK
ncbi:hypothetical protein [Pseudobacillus badius]|uniref:hypothetical protein n=1 Tax=Bacillus badius TaxID=1455 RepID=UPI003D345289